MTGRKTHHEQLGEWLGFSVSATYDTKLKLPGIGDKDELTRPLPSFGLLWQSTLHRSLIPQISPSGVVQAVQALRGDGHLVSFRRTASGTYAGPTDSRLSLTAESGGAWTLIDRAAGTMERYNGGRLIWLTFASGRRLDFFHTTTAAPATGLLWQVRDQFGRTLTFEYELASGGGQARITRIVDPATNTISFTYDGSGNLHRIARGAEAARVLVYDDPSHPWALTGVIHEDETRASTYAYDAQGRAVSTELSGGVNRFTASYASAPSWQVADVYDSAIDAVRRSYNLSPPAGIVVGLPNGQSSSQTAVMVNGAPRLASSSQPAGSGCDAATSSQTYDANGNVASRVDFVGNKTCYVHNAARNVEEVRVEGLPADADCSAFTSPGASLPAGARKFTTEWHSKWDFVVRTAGPGKRTHNIYNGQSQLPGGTPVICATNFLPNGDRVVHLCRSVEVATADGNGSAGFAAVDEAGVSPRTQKWEYDTQARILKYTDPNNAETKYSYYTINTTDYRQGDLHTVHNPLSQVVSYTRYDGNGNWLESIDPNSVVEVRVLDNRQRLTQSTKAGLTTHYSYWPAGQLRRVTRPDSTWTEYEYDGASRLFRISDNRGNVQRFVLDEFGNRTLEEFRDSGDEVRRKFTRTSDGLGRVDSVTGRE